VVTREGGPPERLCAEVSLVDSTVVGPRVVHPPLIKLAKSRRHLLGYRLD